MVPRGAAENRCKVKRECQHPSGDGGRIAKPRSFRRARAVDVSRLRIAAHYKELSLCIVKAHLDGVVPFTAVGPVRTARAHGRRNAREIKVVWC